MAHLTQQQERIVILAARRGLSVHIDASPGEFGPSVDVRRVEGRGGSTITFWRDGSVSISTTSHELAQHELQATAGANLARELLDKSAREAA